MTLHGPDGFNALILAPHGRDAALARALLREGGIDSIVCPNLSVFQDALDETATLAVVAEEALRSSDLAIVTQRLRAQPAWSDFPFVVLTQRGGGPEENPAAAQLSNVLGNVTFLERPFHPTTFISVARVAFEGRQKQYEARARLEELHRLNETLEQKVAERTAELRRAHEAVLAEIEQRQHAENLLRQSQKMEMIGQLTGAVAHDFNNLLMAVLGNLDLLRKHVRGDPTAIRHIESALQGAQRGAALTQRLLAFARRQDLKVAPSDMRDLIRGMTDLIERSIGPAIELRLELPAGLPPAIVDRNQIELALLNLTVNARDAMPDGGLLTIRAEEIEAPSGGDLAPGTYVRLTVSDTGVGMNAETLARAVDPFFSTKELGKGTGLGLSMVHGLAVQLKGALMLWSEPGRGAKAELWLPASKTAVPAAAATVSADVSAEIEKIRLLVVDDDPLIAASTADMLADLGHTVVEVNSGEAALNILRSGEGIDLLITDFSMPKMNGIQLARAAREIRPNLPILLATGYADLPQASDPRLPRIGKPYLQGQLSAEIAKVVKSR